MSDENWSHSLTVRISGFQPDDAGSIPAGSTKRAALTECLDIINNLTKGE